MRFKKIFGPNVRSASWTCGISLDNNPGLFSTRLSKVHRWCKALQFELEFSRILFIDMKMKFEEFSISKINFFSNWKYFNILRSKTLLCSIIDLTYEYITEKLNYYHSSSVSCNAKSNNPFEPPDVGAALSKMTNWSLKYFLRKSLLKNIYWRSGFPRKAQKNVKQLRNSLRFLCPSEKTWTLVHYVEIY